MIRREFCMFYDNLKSICDAKGLKITPIVSECGGAKGSISNWKKGASPNTEIVAKLAVRLNVSTDLLIFGKEINSEPTVNEIHQTDGREQELLRNFRLLPDNQKDQLIGRVQLMVEQATEERKAV